MAYIPKHPDEIKLWELAVKAFNYVLKQDYTICQRVLLIRNERCVPIFVALSEYDYEIYWDDAQLIHDATQQVGLKIIISTFRFHACLLVDSIDYRVQNKTFVQH